MKIQVSYRGIILLIVLLSNSIEGFPQQENYYLKNYTVDHGLPNNHVRSIAQDQYGFIWIATWDAVSRYDGYEFRNYAHNANDSSFLPEMDNHKILVDRNNHVWINNPFGVWHFDRKRDKFVISVPDDAGRIHNISLDCNDILWMTCDKGLFKATDSCLFEPVTIKTAHNADFKKDIADFFMDDKQNVWFFRNDTMFHLKQMKSVKTNEMILDLVSNSTLTFRIGSNNFMPVFSAFKNRQSDFIAGNFGLYLNDTVRKIYQNIDNLHEFDITIDRLVGWNTAHSGFTLFDQGKYIFSFKPDDGGFVEAWNKDLNNNLWLGIFNWNNEGNGLSKVIFSSFKFNHHLTGLGKNLGILSIMKTTDGDLWVGTIGNDYLYYLPKGLNPEKRIFLDKDFLPEKIHSRSLIEFNGNILAGNSDSLFYQFNELTGNIIYLYPGKLESLLPKQFIGFKLLIKDKKANLVIAGHSGIVILDKDMSKVIYSRDRKNFGDFFSIYNDCDSNYWFGNCGIILFLDKNFQNEKEYPICNKIYNIESIIEDDSSHLWLALLGGGICRFNKMTGATEIYSTNYGLKNSTCYNVLKDKHGHIWVSTNQGISMFNPETKRFRNYGKPEGLKIVEFNADAVWHGKDDEMMFGGIGGFVSFYPEEIENTKVDYYAPLYITELKVSGKTVFANLYELPEVKLEKGVDNFQLSFACLDYINGDNLQYSYRLLENDTGWIETNNRSRYANYVNLKPGTYHFYLQTKDFKGKQLNETSLKIKIPPYFYQTLHFKISIYVFIIGLVASIILMVFRYYRLKEKKEREILMHSEQAKRELLKMEALRGQLNPHFIFNSLNSVNDFILDNDPLRANQYLTDFSSLMRAFLDNSKNEFIPLIKEIELLEHYLKLEQTRFSDKFRYEIDIDQIENIYVEITPSMIQPFVENAVWHGIGKMQNNKPGIIKLLFKSCERKCVICQVEDNGIGIEKANAMKSHQQKKRQSRGTGIIKERLDIFNGMHNTNFTIRFEEIDPGIENPGTRAIIEIPIKESEPSSESPRKSEGLQPE